MFATIGAVALVILIYVRPQEFWTPLQEVPVLYLCFALTAFGAVLDVRLRNTRLIATPQLGWVAAFYAWAMVTVMIRTPRMIHVHAVALGISLILFVVIAQGAQAFRSLAAITLAVLLSVLFVSGVGVHQGFSPYGCVLVDERSTGDETTGTPDGRPCVVSRDCYSGDAEPGGEYLCERIGIAGTTSISHGRVRYRGVLQDPNELALAACAGLPLSFLVGRRRGWLTRGALFLFACAVVVVTTVLTGSRGGQLVFLAVLCAYFLRRFGTRGMLVGAVLALPVLALGGRSTLEADTSTTERMDCWYEAVSMWRSHPIAGVGFAQFGEYHYLTAHNSYLLSLSELGIVGLFLFVAMLHVSLKIPWVALRRYSSEGGPAGVDAASASMARAWAMALVAAFVGLVVGSFFLSFTYHYVLWIYMGLIGAFHGAVMRHDPAFRVRFGLADFAFIVCAVLLFVTGMFVLTRSLH